MDIVSLLKTWIRYKINNFNYRNFIEYQFNQDNTSPWIKMFANYHLWYFLIDPPPSPSSSYIYIFSLSCKYVTCIKKFLLFFWGILLWRNIYLYLFIPFYNKRYKKFLGYPNLPFILIHHIYYWKMFPF